MKVLYFVIFVTVFLVAFNSQNDSTNFATVNPEKTIWDTLLKAKDDGLGYSGLAQHVGDKSDEDLKGPYGTILMDFSFGLDYDSNSVFGSMQATIWEPKGDVTNFFVKQTYPIFTAPNGSKITAVSVPGSTKLVSNFPRNIIQTRFGAEEAICPDGPLKKIYWIGDTGSDQDQINGCKINPFMKDIKITLIRNKKK